MASAIVTNGDSISIEAKGARSDKLIYEQNGNLDKGISRPIRNDQPFSQKIFPDTNEGRLLAGLTRSFLIKQEPRMGWARKMACDEKKLLAHPCEVVASHQWGVAFLCMTLSRTDDFRKEIPSFDLASAYEMASQHDLAELTTGDITPVDGISSEDKHLLESEAMESILSCFPQNVAEDLTKVYTRYEDRKCIESKFVKDCDKLDFMITAFVLERQGFKGFDEFYTNSNKGFFTEIARRVANELVTTRARLIKEKAL